MLVKIIHISAEISVHCLHFFLTALLSEGQSTDQQINPVSGQIKGVQV